MQEWSLQRVGLALVLMLCSITGPLASTLTDRIIIVTESWETYANEDGTGLFLDITRAIFEPVGIEVELEFTPYKRALFRLENQTADATYGTYAAEIERKPYLFTPGLPIDLEQTIAIYDRDKIDEWQGEASLRNHYLAWVRGYDYQNFLSFPVENYTEVLDSENGLAMLSAGRFSFFIDHGGELFDTIERTGFDTADYKIDIVFERKIYMAFTNTIRGRYLAKIYDEGLTQLKETNQLKGLFEKYDKAYPF